MPEYKITLDNSGEVIPTTGPDGVELPPEKCKTIREVEIMTLGDLLNYCCSDDKNLETWVDCRNLIADLKSLPDDENGTVISANQLKHLKKGFEKSAEIMSKNPDAHRPGYWGFVDNIFIQLCSPTIYQPPKPAKTEEKKDV